MRLGHLLPILLLVGCADVPGLRTRHIAPNYIQQQAQPQDGFRARLAQGCRSEQECAELHQVAMSRLHGCGAMGPFGCRDAQADVSATTRYVMFYRGQQQAAQQQAATDARAARLADYEKRRADEAEAVRLAGVDVLRRREEAAAQRQLEQHQREEAAWVILDAKACAERGDSRACDAFQRFIGEYPASPRQTEAVATLHTGQNVIAKTEAEQAERARREARRSTAARPPSPAQPTPPQAEPTPHVCCCDGTVSPDCVTPHAGCCAGHGDPCPCK